MCKQLDWPVLPFKCCYSLSGDYTFCVVKLPGQLLQFLDHIDVDFLFGSLDKMCKARNTLPRHSATRHYAI